MVNMHPWGGCEPGSIPGTPTEIKKALDLYQLTLSYLFAFQNTQKITDTLKA